jgi:hypothetical protein
MSAFTHPSLKAEAFKPVQGAALPGGKGGVPPHFFFNYKAEQRESDAQRSRETSSKPSSLLLQGQLHV